MCARAHTRVLSAQGSSAFFNSLHAQGSAKQEGREPLALGSQDPQALPRLSQAPLTGLTATANCSYTSPCFSQSVISIHRACHPQKLGPPTHLSGFREAVATAASSPGSFIWVQSTAWSPLHISPSEVFPPSMALRCTWLISNSQTSHIYSERHPHRTRVPGAGGASSWRHSRRCTTFPPGTGPLGGLQPRWPGHMVQTPPWGNDTSAEKRRSIRSVPSCKQAGHGSWKDNGSVYLHYVFNKISHNSPVSWTFSGCAAIHIRWLSLSLTLFFLVFFNWRIIALQCWVGFCLMTTWIGHQYAYTPSLLRLPLTPPPHPY